MKAMERVGNKKTQERRLEATLEVQTYELELKIR